MKFDTKLCGIKYSLKRSLKYIQKYIIYSTRNQEFILFQRNFIVNFSVTFRITLSRIGCIGSPSQYFRVVSTKSSCLNHRKNMFSNLWYKMLSFMYKSDLINISEHDFHILPLSNQCIPFAAKRLSLWCVHTAVAPAARSKVCNCVRGL